MDFECCWPLLNIPTWSLDHFDPFFCTFLGRFTGHLWRFFRPLWPFVTPFQASSTSPRLNKLFDVYTVHIKYGKKAGKYATRGGYPPVFKHTQGVKVSGNHYSGCARGLTGWEMAGRWVAATSHRSIVFVEWVAVASKLYMWPRRKCKNLRDNEKNIVVKYGRNHRSQEKMTL